MDHALFFREGFADLFGEGAGVGEDGNGGEAGVADPGNVYLGTQEVLAVRLLSLAPIHPSRPHLHVGPQVGTPNVAVKGDGAITLWIFLDGNGVRHVFETVADDVRVGVAPDQRAKLHDRDESRQIHYLCFAVTAIDDAREVEKFGALVDFCPKALLEFLFPFAELLVFLELVQVSEHAHDFWEAVYLEDIEKLECLHFKPKRSVNEEEDQVCDLGNVNHRVEVVGALDKRESPLLARDDGDGTQWFLHIVASVSFDEGADQSCLADSGRADDGDGDWRRFQ